MERQRFEEEQRRRIEAERIEAERIEAERIEAERMEAELNRQQKIQSSSYMNHHHRNHSSVVNEPVEHLLGQSITVNTKEAMSVVQDLWHSPEQSSSAVLPMPGAGLGHLAQSRAKIAFDIHMDSSMTQHAMTGNKHHQYNIQPYTDQENHHYSPASSYASPEHQSPYGNHGYHNAYHYQMQQVEKNDWELLRFIIILVAFILVVRKYGEAVKPAFR